MSDTPKLPMQARPAHLMTVEYKTVTWHIEVPPEVQPEHLLDPKFWAIVARTMRPGHRVVVDTQDMSWTCTLLVVEASNTSARVAVLSHVDLTKAAASPSMVHGGEKYEVRWGSPTVKYRVHRLSDGAVMRDGMDKLEAEAWVRDRAKVEAH